MAEKITLTPAAVPAPAATTHRRAIRVALAGREVRDRYRRLELPDDLFDAPLATLPPREDRDLEAPPGYREVDRTIARARAVSVS